MPFTGAVATRLADRSHALGSAGTDASDVHLIGLVERIGRVPSQHVGQARDEAAARRDEHAGLSGALAERQESGQPLLVIGDGRDRHTRRDRAPGKTSGSTAGDRYRDRIDGVGQVAVK
jgi:hypothetical protein